MDFKTPPKNSSARDPPRGLRRAGNFCFLNSLLQCLGALDPFVDFLADNHPSQDENKFCGRLLACLRVLRGESKIDSESNVFDANRPKYNLFPYLQQNAELYTGIGRQQDVQELYNAFMTIISEEISAKRTGLLAALDEGRKSRCPTEGWSVSSLACIKCGFQRAQSHEPFVDLSLSIPLNSTLLAGAVTLTDCLDDYFASEIIEEVDCDRCTAFHAMRELKEDDSLKPYLLEMKSWFNLTDSAPEELLVDILGKELSVLEGRKMNQSNLLDYLLEKRKESRVKKRKQIRISRCPPVLCVHLHRSNWDQHKNYTKVTFPIALDIGAYLSVDPTFHIPSRSVQLNLWAVVCHVGSAQQGHFFCYVRVGTWFFISDDRVEPCSVEAVLGSEAYLLFYRNL
jgi:ubiquitin C-terminal hydrolase